MTDLIPMIKVDTPESFVAMNAKGVNRIVIRMQDLLSENTFQHNETYNHIVSSGGLHNFLNFNGEIILSLIMKDQIIANFNPKLYAEIINNVKPDKYTTIDGETYEGEFRLSSKEIERINQENDELIALTKRYFPIGLVKGCTPKQIEDHTRKLSELGIKEFVFHVGDFLRNRDREMENRARLYSWIIRRQAEVLILNGIGSPRTFKTFSHADAFVTFRHFISAMNKRKCIGSKKIIYQGPFNSKIVLSNFEQLNENVKSLKLQTTLYS